MMHKDYSNNYTDMRNYMQFKVNFINVFSSSKYDSAFVIEERY